MYKEFLFYPFFIVSVIIELDSKTNEKSRMLTVRADNYMLKAY